MPIANRQSSNVHPSGKPQRLFTFASGGWIVLLALLGCAIVVAWAITPAIMRAWGGSGRPPGDGRTIESFNFDLSNLTVPRELVVPAMLHRDMIPTMDEPTHSGPVADAPAEQRWDAMQEKNDPKYGKYLVPSDVVIGVAIGDESRAYPLHVLYVHEIINDTLAGTPIAVTYNWPCASTMVFDRRVNAPLEGTAVFAHSGLLYNSNLLMFNIHQTREDTAGVKAPAYGGGQETLWCQLTGRPIAGGEETLKSSLTIIPCEVVTWADWSARHPETTVLDRDMGMFERYKDAAPTQYFNSAKLLFPVAPAVPEGALEPKTRVLAVMTSEACRVYPLPYVLDHGTPLTGSAAGEQSAGAGLVEWTDVLEPGGRKMRFIGDPGAKTLRVESDPADPEMFTVNAYWFAWHAMHPEDELFKPAP